MEAGQKVVSSVRLCPSLLLALPQPSEAPYHALHMGWCPWCGCTLGGVSIAEAVATHDQLIQGIIVFLSNFAPWVEQVVPQCVQTSEVHPQVGNLQ